MNRILFQSNELDAAGRITCADGRAEHMRRILKVHPGDTVKIGIINGPRGQARVVSTTADSVILETILDSDPPAVPPVDLLLALPRPKVLKRLWAPLASLGVGRIIVTNADKVERNYFDTHWLEPVHYEPLLVEGLQQAGETRMPEISIHRRFRPLVEDQLEELSPLAQRFVADPLGKQRMKDLPCFTPEQRILLAIGPEGGWVPFELDLLSKHGFAIIQAGSRILRSDVACIALLALVHEKYDEGNHDGWMDAKN